VTSLDERMARLAEINALILGLPEQMEMLRGSSLALRGERDSLVAALRSEMGTVLRLRKHRPGGGA